MYETCITQCVLIGAIEEERENPFISCESTNIFSILCSVFFLFQHKDAYQVILDGVKGGAKEKRLAAQFIPKFFKHFPELADSAINAQLDLCEDEDVSVRMGTRNFYPVATMIYILFFLSFLFFFLSLCLSGGEGWSLEALNT